METKKLKDIVDFLNGFAFRSKFYTSSGIRIMRIANVQGGYISDERPCFYPETEFSNLEKYMLRKGDILLSLTGNVGRVGVLSKEMLPAALNQRVCCLRLKMTMYCRNTYFIFSIEKISYMIVQKHPKVWLN